MSDALVGLKLRSAKLTVQNLVPRKGASVVGYTWFSSQREFVRVYTLVSSGPDAFPTFQINKLFS
jgi:hypothetical protein